jgi:hypothetical protein
MEKKPTVIPVLRILDEAKAKEFYVQWLGFSIDWEHRFGENFPVYLQISKDDIVIHLTEHHGDCIPGSRIRITITGLETYIDQLNQKDYKYYKPGVEEMEWRSLESAILDPFGNHIIFTEPLSK